VILSEETIAIEFERKLRDIASEAPRGVEALLVQINPRVTAQFTGHNSRTLHALEADTGLFFHFEGSEGLALDHFAITFQGSREEVEERALPFHDGDEVLVQIVEPHMYNVDDAVAKIDGYIISIAGAAGHVGEKRMVRIQDVGRTAAGALLLDENGEVIAAPADRGSSGGSRRTTTTSRRGSTTKRASETATKAPARRGRGRAKAAQDDEVSDDSESLSSPTAAAEGMDNSLLVDELIIEDSEAEAEAAALAHLADDADRAPTGDDDDLSASGEGDADDLQSSGRRRGRRGGRRRSTAKAKARD